jgi:hypothetical protein
VALKRFYVVTPEYGVVIPVTDEGQGPTEWGCDVIEIEAETRRDAIALGVREMLRGGKGGHGDGMRYEWCLMQRSDGCSPFTGVKAEPAPEMCHACEGTGRTDNHVTGEVECSACEGSGVAQ